MGWLADFMGGRQQARSNLNTGLAEAMNYYLGPTGIPQRLGIVAEANPIVSMERAGQDAQRMVAPGVSGWDRMAAAGGLASNMAGVMAPALAASKAGVPAVNAITDTITGMSMAPRAAVGDFAADQSGMLKLYHGSPHDFDKFSLDKIGTGEGAQAYGHGLYFAESEDVAKGYRDALSRQTSYDGTPVAAMHPSDSPQAAAISSISKYVADGQDAATAIAKEAASWREAAQPYVDFARDNPDLADRALESARSFTDVADAVEALNPAKFAKNPGRMYEVNVDANPEDFLDWDAPLSAQPKAREAVASVLGRSRVEMPDGVVQLPNGRWAPAVGGEAVGRPQGWPDKATAEQALKYMVEDDAPYLYGKAGDILGRQGNQPQISEALRSQGIPGIRYLDAGSRGAGDGSRNYVVFDDNLISIARKYGLAGLIAAGGLSMQPSQAQAGPK